VIFLGAGVGLNIQRSFGFRDKFFIRIKFRKTVKALEVQHYLLGEVCWWGLVLKDKQQKMRIELLN
jgi:hypothetical protein